MSKKQLTLEVIDDLWQLGYQQVQAVAGVNFEAEIPTLTAIEARARDGRLALEPDAGSDEPEPFRQARVIFRTIEALTGAVLYAYQPPRHYVELAQPFAGLAGATVAQLQSLKAFVASLPDD